MEFDNSLSGGDLRSKADNVSRLDQIKHAHANTQPVVAELNSPPMGQRTFSAELEAPVHAKPEN